MTKFVCLAFLAGVCLSSSDCAYLDSIFLSPHGEDPHRRDDPHGEVGYDGESEEQEGTGDAAKQ